MRTDYQWGIPIPSVGFSCRGLRLYADCFTTFSVKTAQAAVLRLRVDNVRVLRIYLALESIASLGYEPIFVEDSVSTGCSGWSAHAVVVLGTAVNVIERFSVVQGYPVKLGYGQIFHKYPVAAGIKGLVQAAITTNKNVPRVGWVHPQCVIIYVTMTVSKCIPCLSAVHRDSSDCVH